MEPVPTETGERAAHLKRFGLLYMLLAGVPLIGIALVLAAGAGLEPRAVTPSPAGGQGPHTTPGSLPSLLLLLTQIAVIIAVARIAGRILRMLGQPQVIGEMAAGILLGPSLLGAIAPEFWSALFTPESLGYLNALSQVGVVLFMFVVGLELNPAIMQGHKHVALLTSHASITAPFLLGVAVAWPLYPSLAGEGVRFPQFALFIGAAMSVTAFPVLARILTERHLLGTRLGAVAITCAAVDDVTAWCILAAVAALVRTSTHGHPLWFTALGTLAFAGFMLFIGRRLLARLADRVERRGHVSGDMTAFVILVALGGAWITEWLGVHALFGAFIVGVAMPKHPGLTRALLDRLEELLVVLLLPLFFAFTGLRTRLGLISGADLWLICGLIILVAIAGKLGGSAIAARASGLTWRESTAVGILMNTRGLVELVFLNIGLELGVLSPTLFAMMVLMALITTLMTTPLLALVWPAAAAARANPPPPASAGA
jgi:Kef-type K+ transport system membrane component KefB